MTARKSFTLFFMTFVGYGMGVCQTVTNVIAKAEGENISISYDLAGNEGESYEVKVTFSRDGGKTFGGSPSRVSGAVNRWEAPGTSKVIVWEAKKELGDYEGSLQFKVIAMAKAGGAAPASTASKPVSTSGSLVAENEDAHVTISSIFNVTEGFKILVKIRAKKEIELGIQTSSQAVDQFGNTYTVTSASADGVSVVGGKTRKFPTGSRKDGEVIFKISKQHAGALSERLLKSITLDTTLGSFQFAEIPKY